MAFELSLIVGSTTYSLSDGNPYSVQDAVGLGLPPVQRFSSRYTRQDGYDDSGFVLEPRVVTLALSFVATTASALDGYRDDLMAMFSPGVTATLQVERDDGETRRVDVVTTSAPQITLVAAHRPGNLHRAVVQLRAADPIWYSPTPGTVAFGTTDTSIWYLASSKIEAAAVMEATTNPGTAQAWNWGTATQRVNDWGRSEWTVVFRGSVVPFGTIGATAWHTTGVRDGGTPSGTIGLSVGNLYSTDLLLVKGSPAYTHPALGTSTFAGTGVMTVGVSVSFDSAAVQSVYLAQDSTVLGIGSNRFYQSELDGINVLTPGSSYWRWSPSGTVWPYAMTHAVVYDKPLTYDQFRALHYGIGGTFDAYALGATVPYAGNYDDLPVLTLTGPLGDPVVTNVTTSRKLDFTGSTIPAGVTYTIDLRRDTLSVVDQGGTIHTDELTDDSDIGSWAIAAGQSNYVQVTAATSGTASAAQIVYRNRYVSY